METDFLLVFEIVYKVEDVLVRCLDSLCEQSLQDIEVLLIDDGSPDRCGEICEEYSRKDSRCILRSVTDVDAFQSGRFAKQNGRPETQKFLLTLSV